MRKLRKLHLGCGNVFLPGYLNVDITTSFRGLDEPDFTSDVRHMPDLAAHSFDEIYASHVLEHIEFSDVVLTLTEWRRLLRPGGILRLAVPDLDAEIDRCLRDPTGAWRTRLSLRSLFGENRHATRSHKFVSAIVGGSERAIGAQHKVPWNLELLSEILGRLGFADVQRYVSSIDDATHLWPDSLNVTAVLRPPPHGPPPIALWQIESPDEARSLVPKLNVHPFTIEGSIVFAKTAGIRSELEYTAVSVEALAIVDLIDGKRTVQAVIDAAGDGSDQALDLLLTLAARRYLGFHSASESSREIWVLSPELLRRHDAKVPTFARPGHDPPSDAAPFVLADGILLLAEAGIRDEADLLSGPCTLLRGDALVELSSLQHRILSALCRVRSIAALLAAPDQHGIDGSDELAGEIQRLVARLGAADMLQT
jgi:predicted SAM-dependent methyltransferase